jgi:DNA 3'-phosphatase
MSCKIIHTDYYYCKLQEFIGTKIGGFNLAGTIIDAKTNTKKEMLSDAWVFKYPSVPIKLKSLHTNNMYNIVIFTEINLSKSADELDLFIAKMDKIVKSIGIPISYCISLSSSSKWSKPLPGLYSIVNEHMGPIILEASAIEKSFYCGNNIGRPKMWKYKQIGSEHIYINKLPDKSKIDLYFAHNCKLSFMIPETLFCNLDIKSCQNNGSSIFQIPIRSYLIMDADLNESYGLESMATKINQYIQICGNPVMVILIGLPASGKTTLTNYLLEHTDIKSEISKDKISGKRLYNLKLDTLLDKNQHIIIDNTNTKQSDRLFHINLARKCGYKIIGITIDTNPELIDHLNMYRVSIGEKSLIPKVVYNIMMKHLKTEGINSTEFDLVLNYINQISQDCENFDKIYDLYC